MDSTTLVEVLEKYGLSPYQASAYVALVEQGTVDARRVADSSDVPGPRVYDVLRALESKGFVTTYEQDKLYAEAVDPTTALDGLRERARELELAVEAVTERWEQPAAQEHTISIVQRAESVFEKGKEELGFAIDHVHAVLTADQLDSLATIFEAANSRDVFVDLTLYDVTGDALREQQELPSLCTRAQAIPYPLRSEPFGVLVDRQRACYSWHRGTDDEYGIYVADSAHENMIWHYVQNLRAAARPVYSAEPYDPPLRFGSLRDCLDVIAPLIRDGKTLRATVAGQSVHANREREETGEITAISYPGFEAGAPPTRKQVFGEAALTLATEHGTHTVGGFDARTEDIEATRVVITEIE